MVIQDDSKEIFEIFFIRYNTLAKFMEKQNSINILGIIRFGGGLWYC